MKKCPFCAEEIQDEAIKCKHCGEWLGEKPSDDAATVVTGFDVVLVSPGKLPILMIKQVRDITGLGLKEAKDLVDGVPSVIAANLTQEQAEDTKAVLLRASRGAEVRIEPSKASQLSPGWADDGGHRPKCPTCGSTNVRRITGGKKVARVALIGVFAAPKAMKSYECMNCKARW